MNPSSIGIHALVWTGSWGREEAERAISGSQAAGYTRIEIPLLDSWNIDPAETRPMLEHYGLAMAGNIFLSEGTDITSEDPAIVAAGQAYLRRGVELVHALGGDLMCGTIYSRLGRPNGPVTPKGRANCIGALRNVANHAGDLGLRIGLELCNRYETPLLNTAHQALALLDEIDSPHACVHLDTYHMHIEETDSVTPILQCGDRLGYVHVGESHRGPLGTGSVDFGAFFRALSAIGYNGPVTFESFSSAVLAPELTSALCIWEDLWHDSDKVARDARMFIQTQLNAVEPIPDAGRKQ